MIFKDRNMSVKRVKKLVGKIFDSFKDNLIAALPFEEKDQNGVAVALNETMLEQFFESGENGPQERFNYFEFAVAGSLERMGAKHGFESSMCCDKLDCPVKKIKLPMFIFGFGQNENNDMRLGNFQYHAVFQPWFEGYLKAGWSEERVKERMVKAMEQAFDHAVKRYRKEKEDKKNIINFSDLRRG